MPYGKKNPYKKKAKPMKGKSPIMKALVGKQKNLPVELQEKIKAAPVKNYKKGYYGA